MVWMDGERMITLQQYFGKKPHTKEQEQQARVLLGKVGLLCQYYGVTPFTCPNTGSQISGVKNGAGDGGFRLATSTTGAATSSHKDGMGVDVYDPDEILDKAISKNEQGLIIHDLYREHPDATKGWVHLTTRAPASKRRTFRP